MSYKTAFSSYSKSFAEKKNLLSKHALSNNISSKDNNNLLIKTKSSNMGSLFILSYEIKLKDKNSEKKFIDEIRCRNGNLEIQISRIGNTNQEL